MLKRKRPLDETGDTSELLERELENGVQIEWLPSDRPGISDLRSFASQAGVLLIREVVVAN